MKAYISTLSLAVVLMAVSCGSSDEEKKPEGREKENPEAPTDETDMPEVEEVEMDYMYEVTYTKSKKVVMMTQEDYLASGVWENPDVVIKEVPVVK